MELIFKINSILNIWLSFLTQWRFRVNETSQIAEHYSVQMKADMKQKRLVMLALTQTGES